MKGPTTINEDKDKKGLNYFKKKEGFNKVASRQYFLWYSSYLIHDDCEELVINV